MFLSLSHQAFANNPTEIAPVKIANNPTNRSLLGFSPISKKENNAAQNGNVPGARAPESDAEA